MLSIIHSAGDQLIIIPKKLHEQNFSLQLSVLGTPMNIIDIYIKLNHNINLRIPGNTNVDDLGGALHEIVII